MTYNEFVGKYQKKSWDDLTNEVLETGSWINTLLKSHRLKEKASHF